MHHRQPVSDNGFHVSAFTTPKQFLCISFIVIVVGIGANDNDRKSVTKDEKGKKKELPLSGPVLTAPSSRGRLGISLRLSMSTGAAAAPTPKDEPARRSEIFKIR